MSDKTLRWEQHATNGECPVCKAQNGEWCNVKPGEPMLGMDGKPVGFHAIRMARSILSNHDSVN